jgi:hypothetical protein
MKIYPPAQRVHTPVTRIAVIVSLILTGLILLPDRVSRAAATFTVNSLADTPDAAPGNGTRVVLFRTGRVFRMATLLLFETRSSQATESHQYRM